MKQLLDTSRPVSGMWTYTQPETGVSFKDIHWGGFIKRIRAHRLANDLPLQGGWVEELQDTLCRDNPDLPCAEVGHIARYYTQDDVQRFVSTMLELNASKTVVDEEEQRRRIDICATCPKNINMGGCKFCVWIAQKTTELLAGRKLYRVSETHKRACGACGCDITAKTAVPLAVLKVVDEKLGTAPDYAEGCWMLTE